MTVAVLSIVVLVALFAATLLRGFDLGLGALSAAFLLGLAAGVPADKVTGFFPADFFVLIVGVTALFAAAQVNGTLDWLLDLLLRLVGGRLVLVALVPFVIGAVLTAVGTLPAAATAIVAPIALGLAARYGISPLVAAVLGVTGIISGLLSPLAVYGVTARELSTKSGIALPGSASVTFLLGGLLTGLVICAVCLLVAWRTGAVPRGRTTAPPAATGPAGTAETPGTAAPSGTSGEGAGTSGTGAGTSGTGAGTAVAAPVSAPTETTPAPRTTRAARPLTVLCLLAVVVLSVGFEMNVGYLGLTAAILLQLLLRLEPGEIVSRIPWGVVLLIGGLLTYVGLMEHLGAFKQISDMLQVEGSPVLSLLVLCYIAGITSFAASSLAVFVTAMPLLPPLVESGLSPVGGVLALALASVLVDINPLGITGGLILGAAEPSVRPRLFRQLLTYGIVSIVVAPLLAWLAFGWW
ncbi:dicarboxylate carrier protein MatC [Streptomyces sp. Amel2xB2]|uniref:SLC13 family permease n=1 Tax=Streptomyces sp. Amel2xB2 TaxID=1305829 RepID=UPI000DB9A71A|nr:SLC13 family permease [Streptomyces sp. Amel2xB2]RAJ60010.1 dicarboxylate carrier protein MatC [Streptomyces sp. Amel2xB2]